MLINKIKSQSYQALCCGTVYQSDTAIQKTMKKRALYNWILQHPQVVQSLIANDCLKSYTDGKAEPQLAQNLLLQVLVRELHNIMVNPP